MDKVRNAIAQIKVGQSRGTGFLVSSDGLVLTALHVVADLASNVNASTASALRLYGKEIKLRFGDPRQVSATQPALITATAVVEADLFSVAEDWVLLRVTPVPATAPLALVKLTDGASPVLWDSWGFSDSAAEQGTWYRGELVPRPGSPRLELFSYEAAAGAGGMIPGLSGAPLLVANEVVGIIQSALLEEVNGQKRSIEGRLFARRLGSILARCTALSFVDDGEPVPFEVEILGRLNKLSPYEQSELAKAMDLSDTAPPQRLMRRLASLSFAAVVEALSKLLGVAAPDQCFELLQLAALLSLHPAAVEAVRIGGARQDQLLGAWLHCEWPGSAELFAKRAHVDDRRLRLIDVALTGAEPTGAAAIERIREELRRVSPQQQKLPGFEQSLKTKDFCLILRDVLAAEDLVEVCAEFTKAKVLMATSPAASESELPAWLTVRPELSMDFELQITKNLDDFSGR